MPLLVALLSGSNICNAASLPMNLPARHGSKANTHSNIVTLPIRACLNNNTRTRSTDSRETNDASCWLSLALDFERPGRRDGWAQIPTVLLLPGNQPSPVLTVCSVFPAWETRGWIPPQHRASGQPTVRHSAAITWRQKVYVNSLYSHNNRV